MNSKIDKIRKIRLFLLKQIESLSAEQLNKIPPGFNNNIIWNVAHMNSVLQVVCYRRSNLLTTTDEKHVTPFLTNTKPEQIIAPREIEAFKVVLISAVDTFLADYEKNIFIDYTPSPNIMNIYAISLTTIDDALEFLLYHDGYHIGNIMALKHLV